MDHVCLKRLWLEFRVWFSTHSTSHKLIIQDKDNSLYIIVKLLIILFIQKNMVTIKIIFHSESRPRPKPIKAS